MHEPDADAFSASFTVHRVAIWLEFGVLTAHANVHACGGQVVHAGEQGHIVNVGIVSISKSFESYCSAVSREKGDGGSRLYVPPRPEILSRNRKSVGVKGYAR